MVTKQNIINFIGNKNVLLVGNSESIILKDNSKFIDSFDIVVRMNHATPCQNLGFKTDIWLCAFNNKTQQPIEYNMFKPKYVMRLNYDKPDKLHPNINWYVWGEEEYNSFKERFGFLSSTGINAIEWFTTELKQPINIIGFDGFKTGTFYNKDKKLQKKYHNPQKEQEFIQQKIDEGKVIFYAC